MTKWYALTPEGKKEITPAPTTNIKGWDQMEKMILDHAMRNEPRPKTAQMEVQVITGRANTERNE